MSVTSFEIGDIFRLSLSGVEGKVSRPLGSGGQGRVYECQVGEKRFALKCFHPHVLDNDEDLLNRIEELIRIGPPDGRYLWPFDLAINKRGNLCGYLMPLIKEGFIPLRKLFLDSDSSFFSIDIGLRICVEIALSFFMLHSRGLSFQDLNLGAFFINPTDGSVSICDLDNVSNNGAVGGVFGTRKFMAPEIVLGKSFPSAKTDLFSMAVIFFYILFRCHPLEGVRDHELKYLDAAAERMIYGEDPVFIFNPNDARNSPIPASHDFAKKRWMAVSGELKNLFIKSFTDGLSKSESRILEAEWIRILLRSLSYLYICPECGERQIVDRSVKFPETCRFCSAKIDSNLVISTGRHSIFASVGAYVCEYHFNSQSDDLSFTRIGIVEGHPCSSEIIGLRNLGPYRWLISNAEGELLSVEQGKAVELLPSLHIDFGCGRGKVKIFRSNEASHDISSQ